MQKLQCDMKEQSSTLSHPRARSNIAVSAPIMFGIFFSLVLSHTFRISEDGIYNINTRSGGKRFKLARRKSKNKIHEVLNRELLFADDPPLTCQSVESLQTLIDKPSALRRRTSSVRMSTTLHPSISTSTP